MNSGISNNTTIGPFLKCHLCYFHSCPKIIAIKSFRNDNVDVLFMYRQIYLPFINYVYQLLFEREQSMYVYIAYKKCKKLSLKNLHILNKRQQYEIVKCSKFAFQLSHFQVFFLSFHLFLFFCFSLKECLLSRKKTNSEN